MGAIGGKLGRVALIVLACVVGIVWLGYRFVPGQAASAWQLDRSWRVNESYMPGRPHTSLVDMTLDFKTAKSAVVEIYHLRGSASQEEWAALQAPDGGVRQKPSHAVRITTVPFKQSWLTGRATARIAISVSAEGVVVTSNALPRGQQRSSINMAHLSEAGTVVVSTPAGTGSERFGAWHELGTGECVISFHAVSPPTADTPATVTWDRITFRCKEVYGG